MALNEPPHGGQGMGARIARGSLLTVLGFGAGNLMRLASNLILARLLFPEAFGLMALVTVLLIGLTMFSDIGIGPAILSSKRGDDPDFLNTAWTIQLIRSVLLFTAGCAMAWPMAWFYDEPLLLQIAPVSALSLLILAGMPTRVETAQRHMTLGRVTLLEITTQAITLEVTLLLAWVMASVWALVLGGIVAAAVRVVLAWTMLPGIVNRLRWERTSAAELINYGKWIFLSTAAGFVVFQSDKLLLGYFLSMEELGLYNIGYYLAGFPMLLGQMLTGKMMIPIYRESPPATSAANFARLRRVRFALTALLMVSVAPLAWSGLWLVEVLYDPRYALSGPVLVAISLALLPQIVTLSYDHVALASGDSQGFFILTAVRAALLVTSLLLLVPRMGMIGAAVALALSSLLSYPMLVRLARRHGAWDVLHDGVAALLTLLLIAVTWWLHGPTMAALLATGDNVLP